MKQMATLESRRKVYVCNVTTGIVPVQTFSVHIINFIRYVYKEPSLFESWWHKPRRKCPGRWCGRFDSMNE